MSAARRVRVARTNFDTVGRIPQARPVLIMERPYVASKCEGRPDLWEWRLLCGRLIEGMGSIGKAIR